MVSNQFFHLYFFASRIRKRGYKIKTDKIISVDNFGSEISIHMESVWNAVQFEVTNKAANKLLAA